MKKRLLNSQRMNQPVYREQISSMTPKRMMNLSQELEMPMQMKT
jgi:hypothetical protein